MTGLSGKPVANPTDPVTGSPAPACAALCQLYLAPSQESRPKLMQNQTAIRVAGSIFVHLHVFRRIDLTSTLLF